MNSMHLDISNISEQFGDYTVSMRHINYTPPRKPWNIFPHSHTLFELHIINQGEGTLYTNDKEYPLSDGSLCLTGPDIYHGQVSPVENAMDEFGIRFDIDFNHQAGSDKELNRLIEAIVNNPFIVGQDTIGGSWLIFEMLRELSTKQAGYRQVVSGLFTELIINLGRMCDGFSERSNDDAFHIPVGNIDFKTKLDYYLFFYNDPVSADQIIKELNITRRHFSRLMQKYYGMSYINKINQLRVEYSKQLLTRSTLSINEICQQVGFNTQQNFSIIFKRLVGMTPKEYRNQNRNTAMNVLNNSDGKPSGSDCGVDC